jgi:hypothetical protein
MISTEVTQKMDEVIAEKVMGWQRRAGDPPWFNSHGEVRNHVPPYSSDVGAAWMVVERMKVYGFSWWFSDCGSPDSGLPEGSEHKHYATAAIRRTCSTKTLEMGQSPNMPMAICLVALKTVDKMELY